MKNLLVSLLVTGALAMPAAYAIDEVAEPAEGVVAGEPVKAESTKKSGKKRKGGKRGQRKHAKRQARAEQHESHEHETGAQKKIDEETELQEGHR